MWSQIEATPPHKTYLLLSFFLLSYALFSRFIRNRLHLSEPPLALLFGILIGPRVCNFVDPVSWGLKDDFVQELTRVILGIQCFAIGIDLPKYYLNGNWRSVAMMLGPVMTFGWMVSALLARLIFRVPWPTALVIAACLTPTDPVLASSILANSRFSNRVPSRIKHMLAAEAGSNDGVSFPFLYIGLSILTTASAGAAVEKWVLITLLWQCAFGLSIGLILGQLANFALRFSEARDQIGQPSMVAFYLLLAILSVGIGSTLGSDDFLVAFGAGIGFARDGYYSERTQDIQLNDVTDLILNSAVFVYLGTIMPWDQMTFTVKSAIEDVSSSTTVFLTEDASNPPFYPVPAEPYTHINPGLLFLFLFSVLLFRRLPIIVALYSVHLIPAIKTLPEAFFAGHFGPMGLGALFLAIEARAQLENGSSLPDPEPPEYKLPLTDRQTAIMVIWPIICFVVFGSCLVHGLSVAVISVVVSLRRKPEERAPLLGSERERLGGMIHSDGEDDEEG